MKIVAILALILCLFGGNRMDAAQIGFEEQFGLAENRSEPLKQLIPGTEDYYYYSCLYYEQQGDYAKVDEILTQWIKRDKVSFNNYSPRAQEIINRLTLLNYDKHPEKTIEFIRQQLNLNFQHQKRQEKPTSTLPSSMDQRMVSFDYLKELAFADYKDLMGFEKSALPQLMQTGLDPDRRRHLLQLLDYPEGKNLVKMVVDDLRHEYSGGFGSLPIHSRLTLAQLDEVLVLMPELINNSNYVLNYMKKLRPSEDENIDNDPDIKRRFLHEMWLFARKLAPAFNSLKAHLTYHLLDMDRKSGKYNRTLFLEYLKFPRRTSYANHKYFEDRENMRHLVDLGANYQPHTMMQPISNDEELVRDYFNFIFQSEDNAEPYFVYIDSNYLLKLLAETRIVYGLGDMEKWYSLLSPQEVKQLKERVELEFISTCKTLLKPEDNIEIEARVKNINKLIVKVYQINTSSFYRTNLNEISTSIDLDGLVANYEKTFNYDQPEHRRHHEKFSFHDLPQRGIFVIELIGNGISSRALIRKGQLNHMSRITSAGHIVTIFNESAEQIKDAKIWMDSREYLPDQNGQFLIPFSTSPGSRQMVISHGELSSLQKFEHLGENYSLNCGFHVDRESLIEGKKATLILRPMLKINGQPADVKLLKETSLTISTTDNEGVPAVKEIAEPELFNDKESTFEFNVPEKLVQINFSLKGKVENLSLGRKDEISSQKSFQVNGISGSEKTEAIIARISNGNYQAAVLGISGEPVSERPVHVECKSRYFKRSIKTSLQTDAQGFVHLGPLNDIEWVKLSANECEDLTFLPFKGWREWSAILTATTGEKIQVPLFESDDQKVDDLINFYEIRNQSFYRDLSSKITIRENFAELSDLEAGDYELYLKKPTLQRIQIKITNGKKVAGYAVSKNRILQNQKLNPLHITSVKKDGENSVKIQLANFSENTRVHVIATRFIPDFPLFTSLYDHGWSLPEILRLFTPQSNYLSGRNIGDEYKYILERKYARIFAGNMLKRPGLLLNPWSLRKTDTRRQDAAAGAGWAGNMPAPSVARSSISRPKEEQAGFASNRSFANLDFLPEASVLMSNLKPDANGMITIDAAELRTMSNIQIMAIDHQNNIYQNFSLEAKTEKPQDLCLRRLLDPEKNFSEQKNISIVETGKTFSIEDISTAKVEIYDSLANVYRLFTAINPDPKLAEFSFITGWGNLDEAKKLELYSQFACHELNFFIYQKDKSFFDKVVKPYLVNKHDKTFMDHWLTDQNLDQYLEPWKFGRLNIVERILLARRMKGEKERTARHVEDLFDLLPKDIEGFNHLFKTSLKGSALETDDRLGMKDAMSALPPPPAVEAEPMEVMKRAVMKPMAPSPKGKARMMEKRQESEEDFAGADMLVAADEEVASGDFDSFSLEEASGRRSEVRQLFKQLDTTEEWVENNYYKLPIEMQDASLITVNEFWKDFAVHSGDKPFISGNVARASRNFPEMMLALAVLDLPFKSEKHQTTYDVARMSLQAAGNAIAFHQEIKPVKEIAKTQSILTGQNFFAYNDRYFYEKNERFDKFVTEEFLTRRVYGCQVVMTNPTSSRQNVDVLMQIPQGSIPVLNGFYTRSLNFQIDPFTTRTHEFYFYFPFAGTFKHYPVHVSDGETMIAAGKPFVFKVVNELTSFDKTSWPYIAEYGQNEEVIDYLTHNNIDRLDLNLMAFRLKNRDFFNQVYELLKKRRVFHDITWSYGLLHRNIKAINEFLEHSSMADRCGTTFSSTLLKVEPVSRFDYQHKEYWPLVNARVYPLGKKREILNEQFADQYNALLSDLRYHARLDDHDRMAVTYYLLLQDRIEEAAAMFASVSGEECKGTVQYAYMKAFLAFYDEKPDEAVRIATAYKDYPVIRWRNLFNDVLAQSAEITGSSAQIIDSEDRNQKQTVLADTQPDFEFSVENRKLKLRHQNLQKVEISYYLMDIELLFSRQPFVQEVKGQFSVIKPNEVQVVDLKGAEPELVIDLPARFADSNVMIEINGSGIMRTQAYYPHSLAVNLAEQYGQVRISQQKTGKPLAKVYIKVYSRMKSGEVIFYKDGYTDLRGKFDYASLSTDQLDQVDRFAILIMSEKDGSLVREAAPPPR
ncbi:MAG: hypothetical protein ACOYXC_08665 [Candidatus Rifleibacteriota bacterium]